MFIGSWSVSMFRFFFMAITTRFFLFRVKLKWLKNGGAAKNFIVTFIFLITKIKNTDGWRKKKFFQLFHFRNSSFFINAFFQKMLNVSSEHSINHDPDEIVIITWNITMELWMNRNNMLENSSIKVYLIRNALKEERDSL